MPDVLVQSHSASLVHDLLHRDSSFLRNTASTPSPPSTAHGTAPGAPATRSSACRSRTARRPASTKISWSASSHPKATSGAGPVGVTVAKDGALLVTDDGSGIVWRVAYTGSVQN